MGDRLAGKVAVVTGAGSGIGRAIAVRFAAEGARVVVADISGAEDETAAAIGEAALAVKVDVRSREDIARMTAQAIDRFGRFDILSNNAAGHLPGSLVHEIADQTWTNAMEINARGYLWTMQAAIPHMIAQGGGAIINMLSLTAHRANPTSGAYLASKGALLSLTRGVALEYAQQNIRANSISPGGIETPMVARQTDEMKQLIMSRIPMKRLGAPEEVAALAVLLGPDEAPYLSGQDIIIDGARSAG